MSFGILYRGQKSKDEFDNLPHPTKIVKTRIFCDFENNFMKKFKIELLVSDSAHKSLLVILITFFD